MAEHAHRRSVEIIDHAYAAAPVLEESGVA